MVGDNPQDVRIILAAEHITKSFGTTVANDQVSMAVGKGEIVGLVGENGAGKSTLLSILAGFLKPDSGSLTVDGLPVTFSAPAESLAAGIGLVHQHLSLVPSFTVSEQLALAGWSSTSLPDVITADFHGNEVIEHLPMGRRQRVEIARALVSNPKVLLLDEPTSILAPSEVGTLFDLLESMQRRGIAVVIVTHKLREVMTLASRIVVMAGGKVTGSLERKGGVWAPGTENDILRRMFAWSVHDEGADHHDHRVDVPPRLPLTADALPALHLARVNAASRNGSRRIEDIEFDVPRGQIHAIVGVDGQGQSELAEVIMGHRHSSGKIELDGDDINECPSIERAGLGLTFLTDDRVGEGAIGALSLADNLVLKRPRSRHLIRQGFFRRRKVVDHARTLIDDWDIEPSNPAARFGSLSGGNMQRVLAAREIARESKVLVALNPVHGLDAMTAEMLWTRLRAMCDRGGAVLVFTTDLDEALAEADTCAVMFEGQVSPFQAVGLVDRTSYGAMMVNGW